MLSPSSLSRWVLAASVLVLGACVGVSRPKPTELVNVPTTQPVEILWTQSIGSVRAAMVPTFISPGQVVLANDSSEILVLQWSDGKVLERVALNQPLSAGVGSDGQHHALVTRNNELMVVSQGKLSWKHTLPAQVFTPPLVAGRRVFVLMADRTVQAFDAASGRILWTQQRAGEPLVLRQAGTLMAYQNTLVAGLSGRLTGFDPTSGQIQWDALMAAARGLNDLERLVDIVGLSHRSDRVICARAYLSQVGCIDASRGQVIWSRSAQGDQGLAGQGSLLVGVESNGLVVAWQRDNGDRIWESDRLKYRRLSAPVVSDKAIWVSDEDGSIYLLDKTHGQLINRVRMDGGPLTSPPLTRDGAVLMVSRGGMVRAWRAP
ncbi:MAG: PQQ-binding-like beta-propeller repeat protein [Alphaproteobacteria bacterium]|nr:PQQ-binding-like beta-propeller repeat protein [Alphaproteobacteria bacterium]